ncbi:MAG: queuosine precursor transporter [Pseudomonadales bacterium]|nr:queuosine precursor transporter [Pseudomonadales bacterium]
MVVTELIVTELIKERRERVFLILAGIFLCAMTMLNIIGITRFIQLGPFALAVGVLPYPITFLCTDLVSELYGRSRANFLVTVGLVLNFFILGTMWLGNFLPAVDASAQPPWQLLHLSEQVALPNGDLVSQQVELFSLLYATTTGAVFASMIAYIAAQYCDVYLFHFWKRLTQGKHLWLRNNGSTLISQGVDSFTVISITFGASFLAGAMSLDIMLSLMLSNYLFKFTVALLDTPFLYLAVHNLKSYLQLTDDELLTIK